MDAFVRVLGEEILSTGLFPLGGLRVRAAKQDNVFIADNHPDNAFIDMVFRIGKGRSAEDKKSTGDRLHAVASEFLGETLTSGYFMLSLESVEIDADLSWKHSRVHKRLTPKI
jgi:5-carboxymethyl-2-hydroxymuconate isomerase